MPLAILARIFSSSVRLRLQIARMFHWNVASSLRPTFQYGIAEMIIDRRIGGAQIDRAFQLAHRILVIAEAVMGPAQAVDDIALRGASSTARRSSSNPFRYSA